MKMRLAEYYFLQISKKLFDSIDHSFIFATLESFGFGPQFINWIRTVLQNLQSSVMNNGHFTGHFPLQHGTRQGDPLSAYLFILCVEILFIQVRENKDINPINAGPFFFLGTAGGGHFVPSLYNYLQGAVVIETFL